MLTKSVRPPAQEDIEGDFEILVPNSLDSEHDDIATQPITVNGKTVKYLDMNMDTNYSHAAVSDCSAIVLRDKDATETADSDEATRESQSCDDDDESYIIQMTKANVSAISSSKPVSRRRIILTESSASSVDFEQQTQHQEDSNIEDECTLDEGWEDILPAKPSSGKEQPHSKAQQSVTQFVSLKPSAPQVEWCFMTPRFNYTVEDGTGLDFGPSETASQAESQVTLSVFRRSISMGGFFKRVLQSCFERIQGSTAGMVVGMVHGSGLTLNKRKRLLEDEGGRTEEDIPVPVVQISLETNCRYSISSSTYRVGSPSCIFGKNDDDDREMESERDLWEADMRESSEWAPGSSIFKSNRVIAEPSSRYKKGSCISSLASVNPLPDALHASRASSVFSSNPTATGL
jgi:hypothetical protein